MRKSRTDEVLERAYKAVEEFPDYQLPKIKRKPIKGVRNNYRKRKLRDA